MVKQQMMQTYTALNQVLGAAFGLSLGLTLSVEGVSLASGYSDAQRVLVAQTSSEGVAALTTVPHLTQRYRSEGDIPSLIQPIVAQVVVASEPTGLVAEATSPEARSPVASSWQTEPVATIPIRPDRIGLSGSGQRLMTLDDEGTRLQIWNTQTGESLMEKVADDGTRFDAAAISTSGTQVAVITQSLPEHDLELSLWDIETEERLWRRSLGSAQSPFTDDHTFFLEPWAQVIFRPSDDALLTQVSLGLDAADRATDWQLRLHDNATGETMQSLVSTAGVEHQRFDFSADGTLLAGFGYIPTDINALPRHVVDVWQLDCGDRLMTIERENDSDLPVSAIGFTPEGYLNVMSQSFYDIQLDTWDVHAGERINRITEIPGIERQDGYNTLSPDGVYYFARSDVAGTRLFNLQDLTVTEINRYADGVVFNATGSHLAITSFDGVEIFSKTDVSD
ncbi:WD40 repeat domain-containing protein [Vacuolonema iberomarrocanum]|uniref:WD40 repeat domain-containing protein n=1 Tax=Vacuolonema iberomarrocanum TaxID=3454632 RepID=UPI0019EB0E50|nr:hypothetical protein [filamentous cyanobacterium LEGE 07170]